MSETVVRYDGELQCSAEHAGSGVVVRTDIPKESGGNGESFSPSELLSVALGSCMLSMMGVMARSLELEITGATVTVEKIMADSPRRIASLSVLVHVPGEWDERQRRRLTAAAHACPVHNALGIEAPITFVWGTANTETTVEI